jgi:hypothetical protein
VSPRDATVGVVVGLKRLLYMAVGFWPKSNIVKLDVSLCIQICAWCVFVPVVYRLVSVPVVCTESFVDRLFDAPLCSVMQIERRAQYYSKHCNNDSLSYSKNGAHSRVFVAARFAEVGFKMPHTKVRLLLVSITVLSTILSHRRCISLHLSPTVWTFWLARGIPLNCVPLSPRSNKK